MRWAVGRVGFPAVVVAGVVGIGALGWGRPWVTVAVIGVFVALVYAG